MTSKFLRFGPRLRLERNKKRVSVRWLADAAGCSPMYISLLEREKMPPPADDKIQRLAEALDQTPDCWFALAGRQPPDVLQVLSVDPDFRWQVLRHLRWDELRRQLEKPNIVQALEDLFDASPSWPSKLRTRGASGNSESDQKPGEK